MITSFKPTDFFDLSQFVYADLFDNVEHVWDAIPKIAVYLEELFASGKVKGNYAKDVYVEEGAEIDETARILGPTIIRRNAKVRFNANIRGNLIVDENAVVGSFNEVKNSLFMNTSKTSHFNYVSDSLLGNGVRLGVGSVIANKRVDRETIKIKVQGQIMDTNLTKFGGILGDHSRIGANAVINPGSVLGKKVLVYPTESVFGIHDHETVVR